MSRLTDRWGESLKSILREYAESLVIAALIAFIIRFFVVAAYYVPTSSMRPGLFEGDFVFGYKPPFGFSLPFANQKWASAPPRRGEIVIFRCPNKTSQRCIKRVVGLPGDRIEILGGRLHINGVTATYEKAGDLERGLMPLTEKWLKTSHTIIISTNPKRQRVKPSIVPPGFVYVLGDFRDVSHDSRLWGPISMGLLEARPFLVWLSFDWGPADKPRALPAIRWTRMLHKL